MAKGVKFDSLHSNTDLGLILQKIEIEPAHPKTRFVDLPGADGGIDLTTALGRVRYGTRLIKMTFALYPGDNWQQRKTTVSNAINGINCALVLDDDPDYFYDARVSVTEHKTDGLLRQIGVEAVCAPYKQKQQMTQVEKILPVSTSYTTIHLQNGKAPVVPIVVASQETQINANGKTFVVPRLFSEPQELALQPGANTIYAKAATLNARLQKMAGYTCIRNQLIDPSYATTVTRGGVTFTANSGSITANGIATGNTAYIVVTPTSGNALVHTGHKYAVLGMGNAAGTGLSLRIYAPGLALIHRSDDDDIFTVDYDLNALGPNQYQVSYIRLAVDDGAHVSSVTVQPKLIDLTMAFGLGMEPTSLDDPRFNTLLTYFSSGVAQRHTPYRLSGTLEEVPFINSAMLDGIISEDDFGLSAGAVLNDLDFSRGLYHHRVSVRKLSDFSWTRVTDYSGSAFFVSTFASADAAGIKMASNAILCDRYAPRPSAVMGAFSTDAQDMEIAVHKTSRRIMVRDDRYDTAQTFAAALGESCVWYESDYPYTTAIRISPPEVEAFAGGYVIFEDRVEDSGAGVSGIYSGFPAVLDFHAHEIDSGALPVYRHQIPAAQYDMRISIEYREADL